jgi:glycosyltransferase involved in cell wall biosynthesis
MRVYLNPSFDHEENADGGIRRVVEAQKAHFPSLDIEIVKDPKQADIAACHGTELLLDHPCLVHHLHGLYWSSSTWNAWAHKANELLVQGIKRAKIITSPSDWVSNSVMRGTLRTSHTLYHGVEVDEWVPVDKKPFALWAKNRVDSICSPKDMNKLAELIPGYQFISTFGNEADNVLIIGPQKLAAMKPIIQAASLYVCNVLETGSVTLMECMSSGVVPVGWDFGANAEIITHGVDGWLAKPGDFTGLLEGFNYCLSNLTEMSSAARHKIVERFQWKDTIKKYREVYDLALQEPATGPAVSIIVTAYNLASYLPDCLESVLSQDFSDWECIVIDDASPDECGAIGEHYAEKDRRIKVIHNQSNAYLSEARNIGIRASSGRYILPLDADDQLGAGALKTLAGALDRSLELDVVTGSMELVETDGRRWVSTWPPSNPNYNEQIAEHNQVPYSSMYRRWVWEKTGGYRRRYKTAEDAEFWARGFSYGAVPAKVTNNPTLIYSNRSSSMSHKEPPISWTSWLTWSKFPELTPYAASGEPPRDQLFWDVNSYGPVEVSVVIPVGPGHDWYLQDALDSLVAQTFLNWEVILVNDTGTPWMDGDQLINPYLAGFPWVKLIDSDGTNHGVAWARTQGTMMAKAPLVFYLDADDYLQPLALDAFVKTQKQYGGWVYSDWFDQDGQLKEAKDWSADGLVEKMLGPMTGLYPRDHMLAVMFEDFGGWEDWDAQLSLLERGVCGTHLAYPLFTYRYHTGTRREDNFENAANLLKYVRTKHKNLLREEVMAGCRSCGGGGGKPKASLSVAAGRKAVAPAEMALIEYIGPMTQFQQFKSRVKAGTTYRFGGDPGEDSRKFYIYQGDAEWITSNPVYRIVPEVVENTTVPDVPVLTAYTRPAPVDFNDFMRQAEFIKAVEPAAIEALPLSPETVSILNSAGFDTIEQIKSLSVAQLVTIKGIGATRANKIMQAVKEYK